MTPFRDRVRRFNTAGWAVVLATIVVWQIVVATGLLDLTYLPSPIQVAKAGAAEVADGTMPAAVLETVGTAALASLIAAVVGIVVGAAVSLWAPVQVLAGASIDFLRSVPAVSLMPVALLVYGASPSAEIVVGAFAGVWPILLSTMGGVAAVQPRLHEVGRVLHLGRAARIRKIFVPSAAPAILVGLRLGVVTTLVVVVIAEMLINPVGIGWQLIVAQQALRPDVLFAYAVVTGLLGYLVNAALVLATRALLPGSPVLQRAAA